MLITGNLWDGVDVCVLEVMGAIALWIIETRVVPIEVIGESVNFKIK